MVLRSVTPALVALAAVVGLSGCETFTEQDRSRLQQASADASAARTASEQAQRDASRALEQARAASEAAAAAAAEARAASERIERMTAGDLRK